jgi:hypothetical protein
MAKDRRTRGGQNSPFFTVKPPYPRLSRCTVCGCSRGTGTATITASGPGMVSIGAVNRVYFDFRYDAITDVTYPAGLQVGRQVAGVLPISLDPYCLIRGST